MAKSDEKMGKPGRRSKQMMKIYKPGLAVLGFQSVPVEDWATYKDKGWKIAPTFREVETACTICGATELLITVKDLENWSSFPYADLIKTDHLCEMCVADLAMPYIPPRRLDGKG